MIPQMDPSIKLYQLGDFELQSGEILSSAYIAYRTYGSPKNPCILYPTWYSGTIVKGNEWLISTAEHPRRALDPNRYFIVVPALFGNGESMSPSNTTGPKGGVNMPKTTFYDNVRAQHQLLTKELGITEQIAVVGWSMGAGQAFQWASQYPSFVKLAVPFCGSARTSFHNWVFLEAVKSAILTDTEGYCQGRYMEEKGQQPLVGLKALGRVYAGWGFSQAFYREKGFEKYYGIKGVENVMVEFWEDWSTKKDANNMLHMLWTWQHGDISTQPLYAGDSLLSEPDGRLSDRGLGKAGAGSPKDEEAFARALRGIQAKVLIMPCRHDLYFPPEDSQIEKDYMGENAELKVIESIWGHWAGGPGDSKEDAKFIDDSIYTFFNQNNF
ncbi:homoserine acetyltransferase family protein [Basidiobolus meristosporus CBS 931.73]|uniref:Homoserine acetyltransferase family protein n=1 Tax=Basidiobolus meristosporus CBS 931.73 TaxID=1314790 RepID=A0A1Y1XW54_9FUNG|nr:homoserine acetyltransferase family protein [Basidiobolus meristosporus CBS 931.73]|eukprot:ORX89979.1 homoserine acetyltransferase family protein [Basidiobolus meristosporus CBS 931.73]